MTMSNFEKKRSGFDQNLTSNLNENFFKQKEHCGAFTHEQ